VSRGKNRPANYAACTVAQKTNDGESGGWKGETLQRVSENKKMIKRMREGEESQKELSVVYKTGIP